MTPDQIKEAAIEAAVKAMWADMNRSAFSVDPRSDPVRAAIDAYEAAMWRPISEAPTDGTRVLVYAPGVPGLPAIYCSAQYHSDAGWTVCDLRDVTHFRPLPQPPVSAAIRHATDTEEEK